MTPVTYVYALHLKDTFGGQVVSVFTSLEAAKIEGQRYNHNKGELEWKECTSDRSPKTPDYWFAHLTSWKMPTEICIQRNKLDGKAFRP